MTGEPRDVSDRAFNRETQRRRGRVRALVALCVVALAALGVTRYIYSPAGQVNRLLSDLRPSRVVDVLVLDWVAVWRNADPDEALGRVIAYGPEAVPALVEELQDEDETVRRRVIFALRAIGPAARDGVPALVRALKDERGYVREGAAFALATVAPGRGADAVPVLVEVLGDPDVLVRRHAADALGAIGPAAKDAVPALVRAMDDRDAMTRWRAAGALGAIGSPAAVPGLVWALGDEDRTVRRHAAAALGQMGPAAGPAVPRLCAALSDADPVLRAAAVNALASIGPEAAAAVPGLKSALADTSRVVRRRAAAALERIERPVGRRPEEAPGTDSLSPRRHEDRPHLPRQGGWDREIVVIPRPLLMLLPPFAAWWAYRRRWRKEYGILLASMGLMCLALTILASFYPQICTSSSAVIGIDTAQIPVSLSLAAVIAGAPGKGETGRLAAAVSAGELLLFIGWIT